MNYGNMIQDLLIFSNTEMQAEINHLESLLSYQLWEASMKSSIIKKKKKKVAMDSTGLPNKTQPSNLPGIQLGIP